ncbi:capsule biosynthesis protein [Sulfurifustis variabilis]|uniref:Capsule biosynthesis protein n=1 Tax=Sulfurifustis variabilis TaxID=1675686 RepID=A0A1B4VDP1_9GAMM|nr:CapA family protein [Sulfurifustis variabilis]BAU48457.1 capsule biosynthesis protein [Sulfurifustis variabilis]
MATRSTAVGRIRDCRNFVRAALAACLLAAGSGAFAVSTVAEDAEGELRVAAVGDIMLGGTAAPELAIFGYDYPFAQTKELLGQAMLAFGNLEGPLTDRGQPFEGKQYVFRSPPDLVAPALARAGFRLVSLANNHLMDYGLDGLRDTVRALDAAGIRYAGAGEDLARARRPALVNAGSARIALLAYSLTFPEEFWASNARPGTAFGHEKEVRADVAAARENADIVLVSFHWGREGTTELRDYQRALGHAAIDAGAAAVIGHHPHVLQAVEHYRDGIILYSLGNFVFGSYSSTATRSVVAVLTVRDKRVHAVALHPINVKNAEVVFQPRPLAGADADEVVELLKALSAPLGTALENRNGVAVWSRDSRKASYAP